jgi:hypothetical protein
VDSVHKVYIFAIIAGLLAASLALGGCGAADQHAAAMADSGAMPVSVQRAPRAVHDAYRFAAANAEVLEQIPCYCGCGGMGHVSNYNCFWQSGGTFDEHALGCGICVDIAQDVRRALEKGVPLDRIRTQVDADYSRFGPPTDTPPVELGAF